MKRRTKEVSWYSYLTLGLAQKAAGLKSAAWESYKSAMAGIELLYLANYIATDNSAMSFGENRQLDYDGRIELRMGEGDYPYAFYISEEYRARSLLGLLRSRDVSGLIVEKKPDPEIQNLSGTLARLRTELYSSGVSDRRRTELRHETDKAELALVETRLSREMENFRNNNKNGLMVRIPELQKQLADDSHLRNTSVLEFFLGEEHSFAWLISNDEVFTAELPARKAVEDQVNEYLKSIASPPNSLYLKQSLANEKNSGLKLFSSLLGKLGDHLTPGKNLIIIPDGVLYGVPFEALVHNDHHLIEDHAISYLPSATLIGLLHEPNRKQADDRMELLAFGDPDFGPWTHGVPPKSSKPKLSDVFRGGASLQGFEPTPLPRSRDEVQSIASQFPKDRVKAYLGMSSTEDALKHENLRRYKRLHFATHGLIDDENPAQSSVLMTLDSDPREDGFLDVSEIMDLNLDCDLVVLSACQTARGRLFSGEGIVGLSRAFLYAGARSVAVSLWSVGDISTGQLMKDFYSKMDQTTSNAAALRKAKLEMLHGDPKWQHPYYWAPFILVGKY